MDIIQGDGLYVDEHGNKYEVSPFKASDDSLVYMTCKKTNSVYLFCRDGTPVFGTAFNIVKKVEHNENQKQQSPFESMANQLAGFNQLWYLYTPEKH